ncbi:hypothetical protein JKP75_18495, partial [Blastococcus sp. TML/M2B]|nr:hypothetical protein [Blastococcus sp. TML/M2B]
GMQVEQALHEVVNVLAALFNTRGRRTPGCTSLRPAYELPGDLAGMLAAFNRVDLAIEVPTYGKEPSSLGLPQMDAPGWRRNSPRRPGRMSSPGNDRQRPGEGTTCLAGRRTSQARPPVSATSCSPMPPCMGRGPPSALDDLGARSLTSSNRRRDGDHKRRPSPKPQRRGQLVEAGISCRCRSKPSSSCVNPAPRRRRPQLSGALAERRRARAPPRHVQLWL